MADSTEQLNPLMEAQLALEREAMDLGVDRYYTRLSREGEDAMRPGVELIRRIVLGDDENPGLAELIRKKQEDVENCMATRGASVVRDFLRCFEPEEVAFVTVRQALHWMTIQQSVQQVSLQIAKDLEESLNVAQLEKKNPLIYRQYIREVKKRATNPRSRVVILKKHHEYVGVKRIRWETADKLKLGHLLLSMLKDQCHPKIIDFVPGKNEFGKRRSMVVIPTEWVQSWLRESHARCSVLAPIYMPMVVPPKRWSSPFNGGYYSEGLQYALVKKTRARVLADLKKWNMPQVYQAVNALQETPWSINRAVYDVALELWQAKSQAAGLPPADDLPLPAKTFPEDAPSNDPAVRMWSREAAKVYELNNRATSKRMQVMVQLDGASRFLKFERFYFPHALDWRGRAYPVPTGLNPQANDLGKALLRFAEGVSLGENGAFWLAVHGANCYGVDKISYEERVQWVQDHEEEILACALRPLDTLGFWADADVVGDPWQFLAFCFEWAGLVMWHRSGKPIAEYVSHLPVGLDGSCNGLQHFSAMLRDPVGGRATNLLPADKPSDIYALVAEEAQKIIDQRVAEGDPIASKWVGRINRKLTKRNTMTVPYGVTKIGMKEQLHAEFMKLGERVLDKECLYLAAVNYEAIGKVVVAARAAMNWLQEASRIASQTGKAIRWVAPSGMLVVQDYREEVGKVITTFLTGVRTEMTLRVEGVRLDKKRMSMGISPNFVHSLDAAHMVSTVVAAQEKGMHSFAMVHDSYGAHAGHIDALAQTLRESFVAQYQDNLLEHFRDQLVAQLPEELAAELPPCPPMGGLELAAVLRSDYFFA